MTTLPGVEGKNKSPQSMEPLFSEAVSVEANKIHVKVVGPHLWQHEAALSSHTC